MSSQTSGNVRTGRLGCLTEDQEYKLKMIWLAFLQSTGKTDAGYQIGGKKPEPVKKGSHFGFGGHKVSADEMLANTTKEFVDSFEGIETNVILNRVRDMTRADNIDKLFLRFLRARKWEVPLAARMLGRTIRWRIQEADVEQMLFRGEEYYIAENQDETYIYQFKSGKSVLTGHDKRGRPVLTVRVRLHDSRTQTESAMEWFTIMTCEEARLCLKGDIETASIIFDLENFGLQNMDWHVVKFILKCFEAHYPECLGRVMIHRSPWVFNGIWNVIRGLLDPVVANKVSFTKTTKELLQFVDLDQLPKDVGGELPDDYVYKPPVEGESRPLRDENTRNAILAKREQLLEELYNETLVWIRSNEEASKDRNAIRQQILDKISSNYWELDPYVRARCVYDRNGLFGKFHDELIPGNIAQPVPNDAFKAGSEAEKSTR